MITFMVVLIGLLVERFFDWSHIRQWFWFDAYQAAWLKRMPGQSAWLALALVLLPLIILVWLINLLIAGWLYGLLTMVFQAVILLYCLGPKNFWVDAFVCIHAIMQGDTVSAESQSKALFNLSVANEPWIDRLWIEANHRVFGVVFWYIVLGPVGAILYRTIALATKPEFSLSTIAYQEAALKVFALLNWLPARLLSLLFAAGTRAIAVLNMWKRYVFTDLTKNETILMMCGQQALISEKNLPEVSVGLEAKKIITILDQSFAIFLIIIMIIDFLI